MKKLFVLIAVLIIYVSSANSSIASLVENEYTGSKLSYNPKTKIWSKGVSDKNTILLTKKIASDSDIKKNTKKRQKHGVRVYKTTFTSNDKVVFGSDSNIIFLYKGRLILFNEDDLRYTEIREENGRFYERYVSISDMKNFFPNTYIVPVSSFSNGRAVLYRTPYKREQGLLVNNTGMSLSGYRFSPTTAKKCGINGMFKVTQVGRIKYVKDGDLDRVYPILRIMVRNNAAAYTDTPPSTYTTVKTGALSY